MKALVFKEMGELVLEERVVPHIKDPDDMVIQISHVGICGTVVKILGFGPIGYLFAQFARNIVANVTLTEIEIDPFRIQVAKECGPTVWNLNEVDAKRTSSSRRPVQPNLEFVRRMTNPTQTDHTIIPGAKIMIIVSPIAGIIVRMPARLKAIPK